MIKIDVFIYMQHNLSILINIINSKFNEDLIYVGSSGEHEFKVFSLKDG